MIKYEKINKNNKMNKLKMNKLNMNKLKMNKLNMNKKMNKYL